MGKPEDLLRMAKKYANKKTILAFLSFIIVLAITVLSSIPEFVVNPSQILTSRFLTKLIMTLIIGVTSLVCFILIGGTSNGLNQMSEIYKAREAFRASALDIIKNHYAAFKQWVERVRRPAKQKEVNQRVLRHAGITNMAYLDLDECALRDLVKAPNKELGDKYGVLQITQKQFKVIMAIKTGKTAMRFLNVDDYILEKTMGIEQTDEEVLVNQFAKRNWMFGERIGSRILVLVVGAVTFGCIGWSTVQSLDGDISVAQRTFTIIWDILTKIATAITSAFIGFVDGGKFNDFDASYLQIKVNVHSQYREDKDFKPLTDQELAREEYVKYHQRQEEEERKRLGLDTPLIPFDEEIGH
jgi:hypothetical protein